MSTATSYALHELNGGFVKTDMERREAGPHDVVIDIAFAGICHSDIHTAREEWGSVRYPLVPGHEIAGVVSAIGSEVSRHQVGDRVGVGCMVNACGQCPNCLAGQEQYCDQGNIATYNAIDEDGTVTRGGYSTHVVVNENFVVRIPAALALDLAAPLLCAGITLYSPLRRWQTGPGKKVAINGLGGLGHVGLKLAVAMGAEVSVLSRSDAKRNDAMSMGATAFYNTSEAAVAESLASTFDLIVNTVSANVDVEALLRLLRFEGTLANVGVAPENYSVGFIALAINSRALSASGIGGIAETQEMLDFCAAHNVVPEIEIIRGDEIDTAYDRVVASDVRYRFVIDVASFTD